MLFQYFGKNYHFGSTVPYSLRYSVQGEGGGLQRAAEHPKVQVLTRGGPGIPAGQGRTF